MAEIVNLRAARKKKLRAEKEARAAENRAAFGTPKPVKALADARAKKEQRDLEGHRRDDGS